MSKISLPYNWYEFQKALISPGFKETKALNLLAAGVISYARENGKFFCTSDPNIRLFRARVGGHTKLPYTSPTQPYEHSEISAPPATRAAAGRFNAAGVPFLYLSTSEEVALAETRSMPNEVCSVACFGVSTGLNLINLVPENDPQSAILEHRAPSSFWSSLCQSAAQQFSSNEVAERYRSLQYVASVFQEEGYDGIVYRSAFFENHWHRDGEPWGGGTFYNYVLFDPEKASFMKSSLKILKRDLSSVLVASE